MFSDEAVETGEVKGKENLEGGNFLPRDGTTIVPRATSHDTKLS